MRDVLKQFLEWLERVLPGIIAAFGLGYKLGSRKEGQVKAELFKKEIELELKKDDEANEKNFSGATPDDIIRGAIRSGSGSDEPKSGG